MNEKLIKEIRAREKQGLIDYGFDDWQVEELMKNKKLDTGHGEYEIFEGNLYLTPYEGDTVLKANLDGWEE